MGPHVVHNVYASYFGGAFYALFDRTVKREREERDLGNDSNEETVKIVSVKSWTVGHCLRLQ